MVFGGSVLLPGVTLSQVLVSPDGTYLGRVNDNRYDPESISNPYGRYGSRYSPNSVNNPYGQYGSRYSAKSARNPYASDPPFCVGCDDDDARGAERH